jgi:hypothetical protein
MVGQLCEMEELGDDNSACALESDVRLLIS